MSETLRVHAPGRVNLIGEHTDYTGGLVFPMAIDRGTTITYAAADGVIELTSDDAPGRVSIPLPLAAEPNTIEPHWGAYIAAMADEVGATQGIRGHIVSDIPAGAGLSSSAALECAVGLALGFDGTPLELSRAAQRAEHRATGVPTGIMDQLSIASGIEGHATLIDCHDLSVTAHVVPDDIDVVVEFIVHRTLEGSEYADRVRRVSAGREGHRAVAPGIARRRPARPRRDGTSPCATRRQREPTRPGVRRGLGGRRLRRGGQDHVRRTRQPA